MDTNLQLTINSFRPLFPDISLTFNKIPDNCQIPWHFQVFQTSGHPAFSDLAKYSMTRSIAQSLCNSRAFYKIGRYLCIGCSLPDASLRTHWCGQIQRSQTLTNSNRVTQCLLTSWNAAVFRVFGIDTINRGRQLVVGDKLTVIGDADTVVAVGVNVGDATTVAGAIGVALATRDTTDLAGMSGGSDIGTLTTPLCDNVLIVSTGLITVGTTGVTLGTGWTGSGSNVDMVGITTALVTAAAAGFCTIYSNQTATFTLQ